MTNPPRVARDPVIGPLLIEWRQARGLSQDALGKRLPHPMRGAQVSTYERGKVSPAITQVINFARGLQVPGKTVPEMLTNFFAGPDEVLEIPTIDQSTLELLRGAAQTLRRVADEMDAYVRSATNVRRKEKTRETSQE